MRAAENTRDHPRRGWRAGAAALYVLALGGANAETLVVVSWGGPYAEAQRTAFIDDFERETGIEVRMDEFAGGLAQVRAQVEVGDVHWDVVDLEMVDAVRGCDEGLLEEVDIDALPPAPDGISAREDYHPGTRSECSGAGLIFSTLVVYNAEAFPDAPPSSVANFFDVKTFPGQRGLRRTPVANLEIALMADGVPPAEVYETLSTDAGLARAFRKLDDIKPHVLWWETVAQPVQMLVDGEVTMSTAFNGRVFHEMVVEEQSLIPIWEGQLLDVGLFAIVRGTPRLAAARRFVEYASRPESMAALARYLPFTPARRSAAKMVTTHAATGADMLPHMPASDEHLEVGLLNDWLWWEDNLDEMTERFNAWLLD